MPEFSKDDVSITGHGRLPLSIECADHELFLSFNDDDQGIAFEHWLEDEGLALFQKWYESGKDMI